MRRRKSLEEDGCLGAVYRWLDEEYYRDVVLLRAEFAVVNTRDPGSLARWFADHPYLAANDQAFVGGVCLRTVRRWQRLSGLSGHCQRPPPGWQRPRRVLE